MSDPQERHRGSALARLLLPELDPEQADKAAFEMDRLLRRTLAHLVAYDGERSKLLRASTDGGLHTYRPPAIPATATETGLIYTGPGVLYGVAFTIMAGAVGDAAILYDNTELGGTVLGDIKAGAECGTWAINYTERGVAFATGLYVQMVLTGGGRVHAPYRPT